jgi:hypothetical protein
VDVNHVRAQAAAEVSHLRYERGHVVWPGVLQKVVRNVCRFQSGGPGRRRLTQQDETEIKAATINGIDDPLEMTAAMMVVNDVKDAQAMRIGRAQ